MKLTYKTSALETVKETYSGLTEFLTGIAISDQKDWAMSVGTLLQRVRAGGFLKQLSDEIADYKNKGKIKEDYLATDQCFNCLQEVLDCLDRDSPDEIRFNAMKQLFLSIAQEHESTRSDVLPHQLQKICRTLSSGELLVLSAAYEALLDPQIKTQMVVTQFGQPCVKTNEWNIYLSNKSGLVYTELAAQYEGMLIEKSLFTASGRAIGDSYKRFHNESGRLTPLGRTLCKFIKGELIK